MQNLLFGVSVGWVVFWIAGLPLLGALANGLIALACRNGRAVVPKTLVGLLGIGTPLLAFLLVLYLWPLGVHPPEGFVTPPLWKWITAGDLSIPLSFKVDRLSLLMCGIVTGVGTLIHLYSISYLSEDRGLARYFSYLNLFLFAMLILVLAGNLPLLFVGWEGVGLCSYLLIGFWFDDPAKAAAGQKAFIVNRIGDFGFLAAMMLLYAHLSSKGLTAPEGLLSFDVLQSHKGDLFLIATPVCLLLFLGACGKSAQIPLYVWLPDAMAGPTPVSALIHAATMVTAGVYLVARLHFLFTLSPIAMQVVACVGAATAFLAAAVALVQSDFKKILAYSTVSQLGYLFLAAGCGAFSASLFHLMTHAFFKACLFLGAGSVIHALHGEQDIWKMGGLKNRMPVTFYTFAVSVLAVSGIFPFAGFFSKDAILWQVFATGHFVLFGIAFLTSGMTAFYMWRLLAAVFLGKPRRPEAFYHAHESPAAMTVPLVVLAVLAVIGGWVGVPESLMGNDYFFRWFVPLFPYGSFLEKIAEAGHGKELALTVITFLWVAHLSLVAMLLYSQKLGSVARLAGRLPQIHRWLRNKLYIDELYRVVILTPLHWFSTKILWKFADRKLIDSLLVEGSADSVGLLGRTLAVMQTGLIQTYLLVIAGGAILLIGYFAL